MSDWYQELDAPHFDYRVEAVDGIAEHRFRGPIPDLSRPYFACIGGAQTFGRFVADPYPQQLARSLGLPCLNLGLGGAGPRFARHPSVLRHLQQARFVVVQMFSGRSASNSRFDNTGDGRNFGRTIGSNREQRFEDFLRDMIELGDRALLERTVREQRDDYVGHSVAVGRALQPPTVLLWLSRRRPEYTIDWATPFGVCSHYPQLVDRETVDRIRPAFARYVECADDAGLPQRLWPAAEAVAGTRLADDGTLENVYYPSPEMHDRAAAELLPVCAEWADPDGADEGR